MSTAHTSLATDLKVAEQMVAGMSDYLNSGSVYSKKIDHDLMYLTLGGYLIRQHQLTALTDALDPAQKARLRNVVENFETIRRTQAGAFEKKANQELQARLREWERSLKELLDDRRPSMAFYRNDVEKRVMIATLLDALQADSALLKPEIPNQIERLDKQLRSRWRSGSFIWPPQLEAAYPTDDYWWLYGELV
ncbi:MAG: hypothetical protein KDJ65_15740 [Anaerolineae bacterium]|nr:hypothetical protein [Anaerolineae bacterium]